MKFVYYSAEWCNPFRPVWPWLKQIADKVGAEVERVEGILSVLTLDIIAGGETLKRIVRWSSKRTLLREVEEVL